MAYQHPPRELPLAARRDRGSECGNACGSDRGSGRTTATILRAMASRYDDADLDLASVVRAAGVNRNKVNDILKAELGVTFTGYLNQLRLTEAARLLAGTAVGAGPATVSEIAYMVGYNNVSYFNKLFRQAYGCTPKAFRASVAGVPDAVPVPGTRGAMASTMRMAHAGGGGTHAGTFSFSPSES